MSEQTVNLERAVNANFKNITFEDMLVEVISNSIDANADKITIDISHIDKMVITDNGDGFGDSNYHSFGELYTPFKKEKGSKGIGRLSYLKFYREVAISSYFLENGQYYHREFIYSYSINKKPAEKKLSATKKKDTTLTFTSWLPSETIKSNCIQKIPIELEKNIYQKLFPAFLLWKNSHPTPLEITIILPETKDIIISTEFLPSLESHKISYTHNPKDYDLLGEPVILEFEILYTNDNSIPIGGKAYYIAAGRTIKTLSLNIELGNFICFFKSAIFDDAASNDRVELKLPNNSTNEIPSGSIIQDIFYDNIHKIIAKFSIDIKAIKDKYISHISDNFPEYLGYLGNVSDRDIISKSKYELIDSANKRLLNKQKEFSALKTKVREKNEHYTEEAAALILEIGKNALAGYIQKRQDIIETLEDLCKNKESDEDKIHQILFKKHKKNHPVAPDSVDNLAMNNLWVLDDKYMSFTHAFSDISMKSIFEAIKEREPDAGEPDIVIFSNLPESERELQALVIEIKSFRESSTQAGREYKNNGLRQLRDRARIIFEKHPKIKQSAYYLITTLDEGFRNDLLSDKYIPAYSHGNELWFNYEDIRFTDPNRGTYKVPVYVLNMSTVVADAKIRNKTFFDILTGQYWRLPQ